MAEPIPASDAELEREIDRAMRAGRRAAAREPRARAARYDPATGRLVVELVNGATFMVPVSLLQGLADAAADDLAAVEVVPGGAALHWERLDADLGVPALLNGQFGTAAWMRALRERNGTPSPLAAAGRASQRHRSAS